MTGLTDHPDPRDVARRLEAERDRLGAELRRVQAALAWYAEASHYWADPHTGQSDVDKDGGRLARRVLGRDGA